MQKRQLHIENKLNIMEFEDELLDEDNSEFFINFPPEVQKAIDEVALAEKLIY